MARPVTTKDRPAPLAADALRNALLAASSLSIIATDEKGRIQLVNAGTERMLGYPRADLVNKAALVDIVDPQALGARASAASLDSATPMTPGFEALVFKASREVEDAYELTYLRKDGGRLAVLVSVAPLRDRRGAIIGYLLIGTDNSANREVEAERRQLDQRVQSEFLSSMSQELRSPLNAILGFAQVMDSEASRPAPFQKQCIDQILQAGWYLLTLIDEILDPATIQAGRLSLSLEPVSLGEVLLECEALVEPQARARGIGVSFPRLSSPCFVSADRTRMKQILMTLLVNAVRHNRDQGTVEVTCSQSVPGRVLIRVKDTGAGLPPERLAQLLQTFGRLGHEGSGEEGTTIGLALTRRLAELMGVVVGAESTLGEGSTFWIELNSDDVPRLAVDGPEPGVLPGRRAAGAARAPRTLLYVEDDPANLELVEALIARRPDVRFLSAQDGTLGVALARAALPEVILMDINLPGISGLEALRILREDPTTAHIPVVALSANAVPREIADALAAGFFRYLTKPFQFVEFMDTLDLALASAEKGLARDATAGGEDHARA